MTAFRVLRLLGFIVFGFIGWKLSFLLIDAWALTVDTWPWGLALSGVSALLGALVAPWIFAWPANVTRRSIRHLPTPTLLAGTLGLGLGLVISALLALPLSFLPHPYGAILPVIATVICAYLGVTVLVLRQQDFLSLLKWRWVASAENVTRDLPGRSNLPYSHFDKAVLLDTSVIIDGRIADIAQTGFILGPMMVPRFVLNELQHIADSSDPLRRNRGRRGLEMLNRLQREAPVPVRITDFDTSDTCPVDEKLVQVARKLSCPIVTNDYNLNRVAALQGVTVLNVNELANAVKALVLPGEAMTVRIIQEGKESSQGVGYLDDGTMVVVENGRRYLEQEITVIVTKVLQTSAGRMLFAQLESRNEAQHEFTSIQHANPS